jgi:hemoglobin
MSTTGQPSGLHRDLIVADMVARTGITEAMIKRLVHGFYQRARRDP